MFLGGVFSQKHGVLGAWQEFAGFLLGLSYALIEAGIFGALGVLLASLASRKPVAAGLIVAVFLVTAPVVGVLTGIGGQTTAQMLVRFRQDVINLRPKAVVILAGTNDIAGNSGPISNEDIEANYTSLADLARANKIRLIFSSVLPVHNYTPKSQDFFAQRPMERILALNKWLKDYCAANNLIYLDYFSAMIDDKGLLKRDLADDGLHPNKAGFAIMAPMAEKAIEKALSSN
jgi:lysophospholipase L1-like esterase